MIKAIYTYKLEYRAWDIKRQEMITGFGIGNDACPHSECDIQLIYPSDKNYVIQFWIGLWDINKKKIFEGDILCYKNPENKMFYREVKYDSTGFEYDDETIGFSISHNPKTKIVNSEYVVGNIFENIELIKKHE